MSNDVTDKTAKELFAPADPVETTRDRIIVEALNLFYAHGFHAVGLDHILREVGVTKTTFYNHFESKDDLIIAAIEKRGRWESASYRRTVDHFSDGTPRGTILAFFDALDLWFNDPDYRGCLFVKACTEFPAKNDPVHIAAAATIDQTKTALTDLCRQAGADDVDALAGRMELLLEGALAVRLIHGDDSTAAAARVVAERLLDAHCGGESESGTG